MRFNQHICVCAHIGFERVGRLPSEGAPTSIGPDSSHDRAMAALQAMSKHARRTVGPLGVTLRWRMAKFAHLLRKLGFDPMCACMFEAVDAAPIRVERKRPGRPQGRRVSDFSEAVRRGGVPRMAAPGDHAPTEERLDSASSDHRVLVPQVAQEGRVYRGRGPLSTHDCSGTQLSPSFRPGWETARCVLERGACGSRPRQRG